MFLLNSIIYTFQNNPFHPCEQWVASGDYKKMLVTSRLVFLCLFCDKGETQILLRKWITALGRNSWWMNDKRHFSLSKCFFDTWIGPTIISCEYKPKPILPNAFSATAWATRFIRISNELSKFIYLPFSDTHCTRGFSSAAIYSVTNFPSSPILCISMAVAYLYQSYKKTV